MDALTLPPPDAAGRFGSAGLADRWARLLVFLVIGAIGCGGVIALLPIGEASDEPAHVRRVAGSLQGEVVGHREVAPHPVDGAPCTAAGYDIDMAWADALDGRRRLPDGRLPLARSPAPRRRLGAPLRCSGRTPTRRATPLSSTRPRRRAWAWGGYPT